MTDYVDSWPRARKRHQCGVCYRPIEPGETYWRQAGLDRSEAWTNRTCEHCERVVWAYGRQTHEWEWEPEVVLEWLDDEYPIWSASRAAGWRFPDGETVALPFGSTCAECGARVTFRRLWCPPCDEARVARIDEQIQEIRRAFQDARRDPATTGEVAP